jgi:hypothetical protein
MDESFCMTLTDRIEITPRVMPGKPDFSAVVIALERGETLVEIA